MTTTVRIVSVACALVFAGCSSSSQGGTPDGGGGDGTVADGASHEGGLGADTGGGSDSGGVDGGDGSAPVDSAIDGGIADASEDGCKVRDGAPYVTLNWNEGCSQPVTSFTVEWGPDDSGVYPFDVDVGDPCDASACDAGQDAQLFCQYDLRGLEAGALCIGVAACDDAGCSTATGPACVDVLPTCP